jgi:hypothetical protein
LRFGLAASHHLDLPPSASSRDCFSPGPFYLLKQVRKKNEVSVNLEYWRLVTSAERFNSSSPSSSKVPSKETYHTRAFSTNDTTGGNTSQSPKKDAALDVGEIHRLMGEPLQQQASPL